MQILAIRPSFGLEMPSWGQSCQSTGPSVLGDLASFLDADPVNNSGSNQASGHRIRYFRPGHFRLGFSRRYRVVLSYLGPSPR